MRVLHINSYYSSSRFYKNLYDIQIQNGLEMDVFVPISSDFKQTSNILGEYTTLSTNHRKYDRYFFHIKHNKIYLDIIKKYDIKQYSITHAHSLFSNGYISLKLKENYGIPYIVAVRNTDVNVFFKKMIHLKKLGVQILKDAERVVFLSETYRDFVIEKYVPKNIKEKIYHKSVIIPNGIDEFWFNNLCEPKLYNKEKKINLLYVGVIDKNKNLLTMIKAINILQGKGYIITYSIVGAIKDTSVFQSIKDLSYVNYITPKTKEELLNIFRSNDIFVMPSITETFGLVYAEAMSQGIPVIYSKGQGFDGQFKNGTVGFSVNSTNESEIADRIGNILLNYYTMSSNCIKQVSKFKWDSIEQNYLDCYKEIAKSNKN